MRVPEWMRDPVIWFEVLLVLVFVFCVIYFK